MMNFVIEIPFRILDVPISSPIFHFYFVEFVGPGIGIGHNWN
jgi:hypothetical protein